MNDAERLFLVRVVRRGLGRHDENELATCSWLFLSESRRQERRGQNQDRQDGESSHNHLHMEWLMLSNRPGNGVVPPQYRWQDTA